MKLTTREKDAIAHTVEAIGRTGARSLELGFLDDDPPHRWYATAQYQGAKVSCDGQEDPVGAVLGLYAVLAAGGECTTCRRTIAVDHADTGPVDGARMNAGVYETHRATGPSDSYCVRRHEHDGWSGCEVSS